MLGTMNNNSFEMYKTLVASTVHIEEDDFEAMRSFPEIFSCYDHMYGIRVYLSDDIISEVGSVKISEGLKMLLLFAVSNDCRYLELDSDGPEYKDFPRYDW